MPMNEPYRKTVESCLDRLALLVDTFNAVTDIEGRSLNGAALVLLDVTIDLETVLEGFNNGGNIEEKNNP